MKEWLDNLIFYAKLMFVLLLILPDIGGLIAQGKYEEQVEKGEIG